MENHEHGSLWRQAGITVAVVLLAVAALDDITTDNATAFPLERTALVGCGIWFLLLASRLWRQGHRVLGVLSLTFLTGAALAQPMVGQGIAPTQLAYVAYFVTVAALVWFLVVAGVLAAIALRPVRRAA
jgi:peptidoglycan/LPS O-acetylase OafA/YrhL